MITAVEINMYGQWKRTGKQSELEVVMMQNNIP